MYIQECKSRSKNNTDWVVYAIQLSYTKKSIKSGKSTLSIMRSKKVKKNTQEAKQVLKQMQKHCVDLNDEYRKINNLFWARKIKK